MNAALLALLLAAPARAKDSAAVVANVMAKTDALVASEAGKDVRDVAALDRRAEALFREVSPLGWRAAVPLGEASRDPKRAAKARLFAVTFLSRLHDPAAFSPLSDFLLDPEQDADARQAAAQGLEALEAPLEPRRRAFCAVVAQPDLPRAVLDEALIALTRLGCGDAEPLEKIARSFGPRPDGRDLATAGRALTALSRSRGDDPLRQLLALVGYFPTESGARAAAIAALDARRADLAAEPRAFPVVRDALLSETSRPATMLVLVRLADALGPQADALLLPLASHPDAEVLADAAEALARRKVVKALPVLESVIAGALEDPRFGPNPGRPDPAQLLTRVEAAADLLRRARSSQK